MRFLRQRRARRRTDREAERRYGIIATIALLILAAGAYFAYVKQLPFAQQFVIKGEFRSANELEPGSLVRIAGLNIGKVSAVEARPGGDALVTMTISQPAELRADATLSILPRLIFEGNFYVSVNPGTPQAPPMSSGVTVPLTQTTTPVQIDQALDVLTAPTRSSLTGTIHELSAGLGRGRSPVADAGAGYIGLRDATRQLDGALASVTEVAQAAQGTQAGDLDRTINWLGDTTGQLARDPAALADLVTSYRRTFGALAAHQVALAATVTAVDRLVRNAPARLERIDLALPPLIAVASALQPALHVAPTALPAVSTLFAQLHQLGSRPELPSLLDDLDPVTSNLPTLERRLTALFPFATEAAGCAVGHIVPVLNESVPDGPLSNGQPVWLQIMHMAADLAGSAASFDGNGTTFRAGITEGANALTTLVPGLGELAGTGGIQGIDPMWLGYGLDPPFQPDQPCSQQALPDLSLRRLNQAPANFTPVATHRNSSAQALVHELFGGQPSTGRLLDRLLSALGPVATGDRRIHRATLHLAPSRPSPSGRRAAGTAATASSLSPTPPAASPAVPSLTTALSGVAQLVHRLLGGRAG